MLCAAGCTCLLLCCAVLRFLFVLYPQAGLLDKMRARAESRQLSDLTIGPVLTWTTGAMLDHMNKLLQVPGEINTAGGGGEGHMHMRGVGCVGVCEGVTAIVCLMAGNRGSCCYP